MGFFAWAQHEWFSLLQSLGIIGGLFFTAAALHADAKSRRIGNLLAITQNHREIWSLLYSRPNLSRVIKAKVNLNRSPVTDEEAVFLTFLILHLSSSFYAKKNGLVVNLDGLRKDIRWFFNLPIPKVVWEKSKSFQNSDFVMFVESCIQVDSAEEER